MHPSPACAWHFVTDCAVCDGGYSSSLAHTCTLCSSSRRQGLMAASVLAALVATSAVVAAFRYLLSVNLDERGIDGFHRRVLQAFPLQAFKIIIVVWQILTQVGGPDRFWSFAEYHILCWFRKI